MLVYLVAYAVGAKHAVILLIGTYLSMAALGIPTHLLLRKYDVTAFRGYVVVGTVLGMVGWALIFIPAAVMRWQTTPISGYQLLRNMSALALGALVVCAVASAALWVIAIRPRSAA